MTFETGLIRGVVKNYGTRETNGKYGSRTTTKDLIKRAVWTFDYDDLPAGAANNIGLSIPANSTIVSAKLRIVTAFASTSTTTDLTIGLEESDGTDIDLDGLITAAQATQTAIAVAGAIIDGASGTAGALIGKTIGTAAGELVVTPNVDDLTAGRGEMIVEYMTVSPTAA